MSIYNQKDVELIQALIRLKIALSTQEMSDFDKKFSAELKKGLERELKSRGFKPMMLNKVL